MNEMQHPGATATMNQAALHSDFIREQAKGRGEPAWLVDARVQAFENYETMEAPRYRRTDLSGLDLPALAIQAMQEASPRPKPVFTDTRIVVIPLLEAVRTHEDLVRPHLERPMLPGWTKWDALHAALWNDGWFIHVPKGVEVAEPISTHTDVAPAGGVYHDLVLLEPLAKATLVDRWTGGPASQGTGLVMNGLEVHVREGADLQLSVLQDMTHNGTIVATRRALVSQDGHLGWIDGQFGAKTGVMVNETLLAGKGAKVDFIGAFFGSRDQHFDITTSALHRAPHTESKLSMKGALSENGYAVNYSIVFIGEEGSNSSGHQHQETLLLSDKARADAIPKLDVENNEVSASHGAAVGQVDPEQVFYLRTRGLDEMQARRVIVDGFFEPLLREVPFEDIREHLRASLVDRVL